MPTNHLCGGPLQWYSWPPLYALTQSIDSQRLGDPPKLVATTTARFTSAPWLDGHAFPLDQDIKPRVDIRLWLLSVLAHHPYPDQIGWFARRRWPLINDPSRVRRVLGNAKPAEVRTSRTAET